MKLYVGNIPRGATEQEIKDHFSKYGADNVKIVKDWATGKSRGFCFIEMPEENLQKAIDEFNNTNYMGNIIAVNYRGPRVKKKERKDSWKYKYIDHKNNT